MAKDEKDAARDELKDAAQASPRFKADPNASTKLEQRLGEVSDEDFEALVQATKEAARSARVPRQFARAFVEVIGTARTLKLIP